MDSKVRIEWQNEAQTILLFHYYQHWQWSDLKSALDETVALFADRDDISQLVCIHLHMYGAELPRHAFGNIRKLYYEVSVLKNLQHILVGTNGYIVAIIELISNTLAKTMNISMPIFTDTLNEAIEKAEVISAQHKRYKKKRYNDSAGV